jgi:hypothetical protein
MMMMIYGVLRLTHHNKKIQQTKDKILQIVQVVGIVIEVVYHCHFSKKNGKNYFLQEILLRPHSHPESEENGTRLLEITWVEGVIRQCLMLENELQFLEVMKETIGCGILAEVKKGKS